MSKVRQSSTYGDGFALRSLALTFRDGHFLAPHVHGWAQLVYASSGVMRVSTDTAAWVVPSTRAIWIPAGERHAIEMRGTTGLRTLYVAPDWAAGIAGPPRGIEVSPLLRELILHIVAIGMVDALEPAGKRLAELLIDLLQDAESSPLTLALPRDRRALRLARRLMDEPSGGQTIGEAAVGSGASLRTLQRIFPAETGLTLEAWRMRARLQRGIEILSEGASVTDAALEVGYSGPSAFICAFRRCFGETPARYAALRPGEARPRRAPPQESPSC